METWKPNNNVVLCLNGHSIAANGDFVVIEIDKGQFTLCDCNSSESMHYFTTSKERSVHSMGAVRGKYGEPHLRYRWSYHSQRGKVGFRCESG